MKEYNEKELLRQLKIGNTSAFEALFWKYNAKVYNFVKSILFDPELSEDITQNTFIKIWEKREEIDPEKCFSAYLMVISRNMAYKESMKQLERVALDDGHCEIASGISTEDHVNADFMRTLIEELIEELPPSRRQIFKMSRFQLLSNKEIAAILDISEKTVETQIYRSLHFLKERMKNEYAEFVVIAAILFNM